MTMPSDAFVTGKTSLLGLAGFILLCLGVSWVAGWATSTGVATWYPTLTKPWFTPPDGVFAPVWLTLYLMMAVAGWRVWRKAGFVGARTALSLFGLQLGLNLLWSVLFFGQRQIGAALADIVLLWLAIAATALAFRRIDGFAAVLLLPYLAWVTLAVALNYEIWRLN